MEWLTLFIQAIGTSWRDRRALVLENLVLRRQHLIMVQPDTVLRWHRRGWLLYWWWRSRRPTGRPRLSKEVRDLIARLSRENRLWGTVRIRGDLRKLGIYVSASSIRPHRSVEWCLR